MFYTLNVEYVCPFLVCPFVGEALILELNLRLHRFHASKRCLKVQDKDEEWQGNVEFIQKLWHLLWMHFWWSDLFMN